MDAKDTQGVIDSMVKLIQSRCTEVLGNTLGIIRQLTIEN